MPILLQEDLLFPLPKMHKVRQSFAGKKLENIPGAIADQINKDEIKSRIFPGAKVAVAVGSRGIRNLDVIVKSVIENIKLAGGEPFIVSAMGSHGSGTPEGQLEVLESYGISAKAMGVPVITQVDVELLGTTSRGVQIFFDKVALSADLVVPVNRIKLHTDFVADIQSGLCKMLVIGLGNHKGCSAAHEDDFDTFGETLIEGVNIVFEKAKVGFGIAIIENAYDETQFIEAVPQEDMIKREKELVQVAKGTMPEIMIPEIDILVVEEIGKDISGSGFDPNILGKSYILKEFVLKVPKINRMILLGVSEPSHGNAVGLGIFDIITRKLFDKLDLEPMYANAIAVKCLDDVKIPLIADSEKEALLIAVKVLRGADKDRLRIVKIKNTLELGTIEVSDALLEYVNNNELLEEL